MNMKLSELINQIITEWSYRVENGMPDATNPTHLIHLGIVLKEMGLSHIKQPLIENLLMEKGKTPDANVAEAESNFTNPALNKSIKYKNDKGEDAEGIVGNLLRLPKEHPGRVAAEKTLPADGTPERDALNKDLGGQNQPGGAEKPKDDKGGEEAPKEDPAKAAAAMFDPKADPAMAARMDKEKEVQAQIAKDAEKAQADFKAQAQKAQDDFKAQSDKAQSDFKAQAGDKVQKAKAKGYDFYKLSLNADELKAEEDKERNAVADAKAAGDEKGAEAAALKYTQTRIARAKKEGDKEAEQMWSDEYVSKRGEYENKYGEQPEDEFDLSKDKAKSDSNEFKPIDSKDVAKEMPQADPETFAGGSDIPDGVKPEQLEKFNTDIQKVAKQVADAKAKGEPAPNINLCDVTVPGTNLYCDDNLGIPRDEMPQFKGTAQPGSRAAGMDVDASGEVDTEPVFKEMLAQKGIKTLQTQIPADKLKATQKDLVGAKVVGMMGALEKDPNHPKITAPIYVSRDGHVIDGHHRWAAVVAYNAANPDKQIQMKTTVLDQDIKDAIPMANKFAEDMGIAAKKADANKEAPSTPTSVGKNGLTDKVKKKIENWTKEEKAFFEKNEGAPGSETRRSLGQALKDKAAGALKAIKKGAKHEVHIFKDATKGVSKFFAGQDVSEEEVKAIKSVGIKIATTAIFAAGMGGLAAGAAGFAKLVAIELVPHVVAETVLLGAGRAAVFADANGEAEDDANMIKFTELIAKGIEEMEITPEMMEDMVDSYNEKKESGEMDNVETPIEPKVKAEHLHLVDELMLEMIYGFIEEATATTKDWKLAARIGGPDGKIVYFGSKENKNAAIAAGSHVDVDKKLNAKAEQPKNEPVAGADLFKGDYEKERGTGKGKKGGSFKDSYLNNSKAGKPEKAQEDFEKRRQKALSQIDKAAEYNSDTPGVFRLETEEGSGKFTEIKTEDVKIAINKLFNGEKLSANDKKNLNLTTKIVTNPENGDVKLYFAKKIAGRQPQQGYESVLMAEKNIPMGDAFREYAIENGLKVGKSGEGAFGKKQINPNKVAKGGNPKEPIKNLKVKSDKNGIEVDGKRFNYKPIPTESELNKLKEKLLKKGVSPEEADERIRILVNTRKKENQVLSTIAEVASKSGGEIPYCNFGDVFTPEGRKATITNVITGVTKMFTDGLNSHQNTFNTENLLEKPENKKAFDTLKRLQKISKSSNLETDKEAQLAFKKELDQLLIDMADSVDFKDSVADFAEMVVGLGSLAEGKRVMFPSAENFQTADIIVLPSGESISDADLVNVSIEELDLTGGVSIKSDGGGGSALKNRIELTEYKNPKTKEKLLNALNTYQTAYGNQQDVKEEDLVKGEAIMEDLFKYGVEIGCFTKQDIEKIKKIGEKQGQSEIKTAGDAGNCGGKENQKRLHRAMILQHQQLQLTCVIGNCDTDWTGYSNVNKKYSKKKGKVVKVTDDIADGVKKPCYSNPHHNPGYTKSVDKNGCVSLTPSNQNPAHIVSKIPDLINNFKE
jgi:hypothetical protein